MLFDLVAARRILIVLGFCLLVTECRAELTQELLERLSQSEEECDVSGIGDVISCSGPIRIGSDGRHVVSEGEVCVVGRLDLPDKVLRCQEAGFWLEEGRHSEIWRGNHHREKRFIFALIFGLVAGTFIGASIASSFARRTIPWNTTPTIACPPNLYKMADEGMTSARVWWDSPMAKDKEDGNITSRVTHYSGPAWGSSVSEGSHKVQYKVKDSRGASAYCSFYVNVTVVRCPRLSVPSHGSLNCTLGSIHGSECWLSCHEGYKTSGASGVRCEKDGQWTPAGTVACEELKCPPPPMTANGWYDCPEKYRYKTTCHLNCSKGFIPRGALAIECQSNLTWSGSGHCKDDKRPTFMGCPSDLRVIADPGKSSFQLNWTKPSVTDNSETVNITTESHSPGSWFDEGNTGVVYRAEDGEKNVATCAFIVTVVVLKCEPPDFDKSNMNLMEIHGCTHGFIRGSTCDVSCRSGFPHLGAKAITCVADLSSDPPKATWTANDPSGRKPECRVYPCPELKRPGNGALVCDNWSQGRMCSMVCHENFDVPRRMANGAMYACGMSTGRWLPNNQVPDCNRARQPHSYRLPGSVYYYSGDCPSNETELQIKQQFIQIMLGHPVFSGECQNNSGCRLEDMSVYCGNVTRPPSRHSRSLDMNIAQITTTTAPLMEVKVEFVMTLPFTPDFEVKRGEVMNAFLENATSGTFDLDLDNVTLEAKDVSVGHPYPQCSPGSIFNVDSSNCAGCEVGTYYSTAADDCLKCPVGSYGDEGFLLACKTCPENTSTVEDGATSPKACIPLCEAGHQSVTGLVPCSPCPLGRFQPQPGRQSCLPCPANFSTPSLASISNTSCLALTACEKKPCGDHPCNSVLGGFECSCQGGWSGPLCEIPPDPCHENPCHNNASCVNEGVDFSCACREGFFGDLCQNAVVDGGWGTWDSWGACSISCGGGERSRTRLCDDPAPGPRGQRCKGSASVEEECNMHPCPVCETLEQPRGVEVNCTEESDSMLSCTVSCRRGLVFAEQPASYYQCGPATNFNWSHKLNDSNFRIPACSPVSAPSTLNLTTTTRYIPCDVIQENESSVVISMTSGTSRLKCVTLGLCRPHVTVGGCSKVRGKRSASSHNATVEVTLTASMEEEELDFVQFFENKTMTEAVKRFVDSLVALVTSGEELYNNTDDVLTIEVNGEVFSPEPGSANFTGSKSCRPGNVPVEAFCSPCPEGTRQWGEECVLCGRAGYQDLAAQTSCKACPPWSSTPLPGATSLQQCVVHCPAGRRHLGETCEECDTHSYQDREGQTSCKPCPPGHSTPHPGATALSQCSGCGTFYFAWWTVLLGLFCAS